MKKKDFSAYKLFLYLTLAIFAVELLIMFLLRYLPISDTGYLDNFIDAFILVMTISPLVYFLGVKPLQAKIREIEISEDIIEHLNKEKEIEKARTDILALASHQLRTPLSGTKWLIETLRKGIHGPLNEKQDEYLVEIYKTNERMTSLVNDMFSVLRLENDSTTIKNEKVPINTILNGVLGLLSGAAQNKNVSIELPKNMDYLIDTNASLLQNLVESIVSNAINYSYHGGQVIIDTQKEAKELVISIKDFGIGIPEDEKKRLFERFYRASNAKTFDTHGTGLGLYIVETIAKKIGVQITLESVEGKGSTFYVHIPVSTRAVCITSHTYCSL